MRTTNNVTIWQLIIWICMDTDKQSRNLGPFSWSWSSGKCCLTNSLIRFSSYHSQAVHLTCFVLGGETLLQRFPPFFYFVWRFPKLTVDVRNNIMTSKAFTSSTSWSLWRTFLSVFKIFSFLGGTNVVYYIIAFWRDRKSNLIWS